MSYVHQDQMHYEHPYKVGTIDLIWEMGWLSYAHEDSVDDIDYINLDPATDNMWMSSTPEASAYIVWEGNTSPQNIKRLAIKLYETYQATQQKQQSEPTKVQISIFSDALSNRHALPTDVYKVFKACKFWQTNYKHITTVTRTNLDDRTLKAVLKLSADFERIVNKSGVFDLVKQNWTFRGDVARTDKQAVTYRQHEQNEANQLKSWERSMKRMDMLPSAAGTILDKMIQES